MRIELLAECVNALKKCDIDDPKDQKTISVCENYIMHSYDLYLESCDLNGYEPLTQKEYMEELMLNEGFFKKLLGGAAIAAGAIGAAKGINAVNANAKANGQATKGNGVAGTVKQFGSNAKQLYKQSGGVIGTAKNVAGTSLQGKVATQQYVGSTRDTNVTTGKQSISLASRKEATDAVKNNTNLQGNKTISYDRHGETKTVDANSTDGQKIIAGQQKMEANKTEEAQKARAEAAKAQSEAAKAENKRRAALTDEQRAAEDAQRAQEKKDQILAQQAKGQADAKEAREKADAERKKQLEASATKEHQAELKAQLLAKQQARNKQKTPTPAPATPNPQLPALPTQKTVQETFINIFNKIFDNEQGVLNEQSMSLANISVDEVLDMAVESPFVSLEEFNIINDYSIPESMFRQTLREFLGFEYNPSQLSKPLTPSIRMPSKMV